MTTNQRKERREGAQMTNDNRIEIFIIREQMRNQRKAARKIQSQWRTQRTQRRKKDIYSLKDLNSLRKSASKPYKSRIFRLTPAGYRLTGSL